MSANCEECVLSLIHICVTNMYAIVEALANAGKVIKP